MSMSELFFGIFCIVFNTWDKIFGDINEYYTTCSWMKMWMKNENG
jgi:hypothetical protein